MKDIKSLYLAAKSSGTPKDIASYTEAIHELLESNPSNYISNLEYIISSSIGLQTWNEFVDKHGLSIAAYDDVIACFEKCCEKCKNEKRDSSKYEEEKAKLESYKAKYKNCFTMYEAYRDDIPKSYVSTYYGSNNSGIRNNRLIVGMISHYGEAAIPDALITAEKHGVIDQALNYLGLHYLESTNNKTPIRAQWIAECCADFEGYNKDTVSLIYENTLEKDVNAMVAKTIQVMRESTITGDEDAFIEYTEHELEALQDLISFKEYQMTCMENVEDIMRIQNNIYSLYEEFDGILNEDGTLLMFNESNNKELKSAINKVNKKINSLSKTIKSSASKMIHKYIVEFNNKKGNDTKVPNPKVSTSIGNKTNPYFWGKNSITNRIGNIVEEKKKGKVLDDIVIHLLVEFNTKEKMTKNTQKNISSTCYEAISQVLNPLIKENKISVKNGNITAINPNKSKYVKEATEETSYTLTFDLPIYICRSYVMEGLDSTLCESACNEIAESIADSIAGMLPVATGGEEVEYTEDTWYLNTHDKKTGQAPRYLSANHDLGYGEDDGNTRRKSNSEITDDEEKSLEDYRRPSATPEKELPVYTDEDLAGKEEPKEDETVDTPTPVRSDSPINTGSTHNNYYYYTYNNSMNKNSNSFNKDNSTDNSIHNRITTTDSSKKTTNVDKSTTINGAVEKDDNYRPLISESVRDMFELKLDLPELIVEATGDADKDKPQSDHPIKDTLQDIDRATVKTQQAVKKKAQDVHNVGRAALKPVRRTQAWVTHMIQDWKDKDETKVKEKLADPNARKNIFSGVAWCIKTGSFLKAGLLLNPIFLFLSATRKVNKNSREGRLRAEMIGELKTEMNIIDEKIKDASEHGNNKEKYQLMRLKNEMQKKLIRVGGGKQWAKVV